MSVIDANGFGTQRKRYDSDEDDNQRNYKLDNSYVDDSDQSIRNMANDEFRDKKKKKSKKAQSTRNKGNKSARREDDT